MSTDEKSVCITGTGSCLPERIMTNKELEQMVDTTDEWIRTRTGISERRIAADDQATSDMAAEACRRAMEDAGVAAEDIDLIICATITPDTQCPGTACYIQSKLGISGCAAFDVVAACSGFLYSLEVAQSMMRNGRYSTVLVVGAEKMTAIADWEDRSTCILFGDGAGAVVLQAKDSAEANGAGIRSMVLAAEGKHSDLLYVPAGGSRMPATEDTVKEKLHAIKMSGNTVFKHAVRCMGQAAAKAVEDAGFTMDDIDCVIPHQANMRIITAISERVGVPLERFHNNLDRVGNTTAASVPLALDDAKAAGRVKQGDKVLFLVFGAGFTWGASVVQL